MTTPHPVHAAKIEQRRREREAYAERLHYANLHMQQGDMKFYHIRPDVNRRGLTVAYRELKKNLLEIAVATPHPNDTFSKQMGRIVATEHMVVGRTIILRKPTHWYTPDFLYSTFNVATRE